MINRFLYIWLYSRAIFCWFNLSNWIVWKSSRFAKFNLLRNWRKTHRRSDEIAIRSRLILAHHPRLLSYLAIFLWLYFIKWPTHLNYYGNDSTSITLAFLAGIISLISIALPIFQNMIINNISPGAGDYKLTNIDVLSLSKQTANYGFTVSLCIAAGLLFGVSSLIFAIITFLVLLIFIIFIFFNTINLLTPIRTWEFLISHSFLMHVSSWFSKTYSKTKWNEYDFKLTPDNYICEWITKYEKGGLAVEVCPDNHVIVDINPKLLEYLALIVLLKHGDPNSFDSDLKQNISLPDRLLYSFDLYQSSGSIQFPYDYVPNKAEIFLAKHFVKTRPMSVSVLEDRESIRSLITEIFNETEKALRQNEDDMALRLLNLVLKYVADLIKYCSVSGVDAIFERSSWMELSIFDLLGQQLRRTYENTLNNYPYKTIFIRSLLSSPRRLHRNVSDETPLQVRLKIIQLTRVFMYTIGKIQPE